MTKDWIESLGITQFILAVVAFSSILSLSIAGIIVNSVVETYEENIARIISADVYEAIVKDTSRTFLGAERNIIEKYEKRYGIKAVIVDTSKLVKISTDNDMIDKKFPIRLKYQQDEEFIFNKIIGRSGDYIVTKYIPDFDLYLVIQRDKEHQQNAFKDLVLYIAVVWIVLLALLLTYIQVNLNKGQRQLEDEATRHGITSHSGLYVSMHLIDLEKDTIHKLSSDPAVKVFEVQDGRHAKAKLISAVKKMTQQESLPNMLDFIRLSNLSLRMSNKQAIYQEFLSEEFGWCKAYFMLVDSNKDGTLKKIVFAIELIDAEKRREKHLQYLSESWQR